MGSPVTCRKSSPPKALTFSGLRKRTTLPRNSGKSLSRPFGKRTQEIWIIFSPNEVTGFVYQNFVVKPPKDAFVRMISWNENPFLR
ncbi:terminase large subunit [Pseudomonas phage WP1]